MRISSLVSIALFCAPVLSAAKTSSTSLEKLEMELLSNSPQIQASEANIQSQKATSHSFNGSFLPAISIHGGYGDENTLSDVDQGYLGYISGSWNIFKGGEDILLKRISERQHEIAQLEKDQKTRALIRQLREIFYSILGYKKTLLLLEEKSQILDKQRSMAQKKINAGLTSSVDRIEIDLEENSIHAEQENIKIDLQKLNIDLQTLLNSTVSENSISSDESFDSTLTRVNIEESLTNNPALRKQTQIDEITHHKASQARSEFLPHINVDASYGRLTPSFGDPLRGTESKLSILLSWNLFSGMSSYYKSQASTLDTKSQILEHKNIRLELKKDLENLIASRSNIVKLQELHRQRLSFATKYYDMTLADYKRGIKNSADLETATSSLFGTRRKIIDLSRDLSIVNAKINELI